MTALSDVLQIRDCQPEHGNSTRSQSAADRKALLANRRINWTPVRVNPGTENVEWPSDENGSTVTQFLVLSRVMAGCRDGTVEISV
jgi:hypothetical protein